jgi:hypothetical protein
MGGKCYRAPHWLRRAVYYGVDWLAGPWWLGLIPGWSNLIESGLTPEDIARATSSRKRYRVRKGR